MNYRSRLIKVEYLIRFESHTSVFDHDLDMNILFVVYTISFVLFEFIYVSFYIISNFDRLKLTILFKIYLGFQNSDP